MLHKLSSGAAFLEEAPERFPVFVISCCRGCLHSLLLAQHGASSRPHASLLPTTLSTRALVFALTQQASPHPPSLCPSQPAGKLTPTCNFASHHRVLRRDPRMSPSIGSCLLPDGGAVWSWGDFADLRELVDVGHKWQACGSFARPCFQLALSAPQCTCSRSHEFGHCAPQL